MQAFASFKEKEMTLSINSEKNKKDHSGEF